MINSQGNFSTIYEVDNQVVDIFITKLSMMQLEKNVDKLDMFDLYVLLEGKC